MYITESMSYDKRTDKVTITLVWKTQDKVFKFPPGDTKTMCALWRCSLNNSLIRGAVNIWWELLADLQHFIPIFGRA